jgi:hypothetical protein
MYRHPGSSAMKKLLIGFIILLSACAQSHSSPQAQISMVFPSQTSTLTRVPTSTPTPTIRGTPTPTPTPDQTPLPTKTSTATLPWPEFPSLNPDGPYLYWASYKYGNVVINADGSGMGRIDLPAHEIFSENIIPDGKWVVDYVYLNNISPDGEWALMFQGGPYDDPWDQDLTLSLVHLPDGEVFFISVILPNSTRMDRYDSYECGDRYVEEHFRLAVWSPNGRFLAYAAYADSGTTDLFVLDAHDRSVHRLTSDPAEIEQIVWSPASDKIFYTNGNNFDVDWASSGTFTINRTQPGNATNRGIQTLALSDAKLLVEGFDREDGVIYAAHENRGCLAGGFDKVIEISYFQTSTNTTTLIGSGEILGPSLLVDPVNRAVFFNLYDPDALGASSYRNLIVSFEGKLISTIDSLSVICAQTTLLSGPKYAYLCVNTANRYEVLGVTFGGKTDVIAESGDIFISPDRKWFFLEGLGLTLYSRDGKMVESWDDSFPYLWAPDGKGFYFAPSGKSLLYYSFSDKKSSVVFLCPFNDECGFSSMEWIP